MDIRRNSRRCLMAGVLMAFALAAAPAAELNPAAVAYKLPDQIPWSTPDARGVQTAVLVGDPSKPGFYMVFTK